MTIEALLKEVKPGAELMIANQPFTYGGMAVIELDGGDMRHWMFGRDGAMLAVSPVDEEIILFLAVDEALEAEDEVVLHRGVDYEFSYEDVGTVNDVSGEADVAADERYRFSDYENESGERVRLVINEDTQDVLCYAGSVIVEDDISSVE